MKLRNLKIENFRGIKSLDWYPEGTVVCLVGPGDSCKTTILDAIECVLAPRGFLTFTDTDFFNSSVEQPITIFASVGELPNEFFAEDMFGSYLRGYKSGELLADDPEDGWEPILTVRLVVTKDLEPTWHVVKDSNPEPRQISWRDRERLGVTRLGNDAIRHFTWGRGSSLAKLTGKEQSAGEMLASVARVAQKTVSDATLTELQKAAVIVQKSAAEFGVSLNKLRPGLDTQAITFGIGALGLHDDAVPLRAKGLGSRRLAALAIQNVGVGPAAITLVDEIEYGLEPFRIRQVLRKLCDGRDQQIPSGQVLMTSHSPSPIIARPVTDLRFVRCNQGVVTITKVELAQIDRLQAIARTRGHAFLARKVLVCEGKTEDALCRALDVMWPQAHENCGMAYCGVVPIDGEGTNAAEMALEFRRLGYDTMLFCDSDVPISPDEAELTAKGITVIQWNGNLATEQCIARDLPFTDLQNVLNKACELYGEVRILDACRTKSKEVLDGKDIVSGVKIESWKKADVSEDDIRKLIGLAAKQTLKGWFKDMNAGSLLGKIVVDALPKIPDTGLAEKLNLLQQWVYG